MWLRVQSNPYMFDLYLDFIKLKLNEEKLKLMEKLNKDIICSLGFGINISLMILFYLRVVMLL